MNEAPNTFLSKVILIPIDQVAADYLKVEINYMKKLIKKGEMPFITMQGVEMVRMWDIMEFIERNLQRYDPTGEMVKGLKAALKGDSDGEG